MASDLKVTLLDGKTSHPLHRKMVCISFNPDPRGNGIDKPNVCGTTDVSGSIAVELPRPEPQLLHLAVLTNDLLPCFAIPHAFTVSTVMAKGEVARDTCAAGTPGVSANAGQLIAFAHQMTFLEVLKSMWREL